MASDNARNHDRVGQLDRCSDRRYGYLGLDCVGGAGDAGLRSALFLRLPQPLLQFPGELMAARSILAAIGDGSRGF